MDIERVQAGKRRHAVITIAFQRGYGQLCRHPDLARNSRSGCLSSLLLSARNIRIKNRRGFSRFLYQTFDFAYQSRISRRSEEHTSELQSLMRISYAVFCLKKKNKL